MIINAYSVYDRKALMYNTPFFAVADGVAVRQFGDLANDLATTIGRHPSDYVLYRVGGWDDQKGAMLAEAPLVHIADAMALVKPTPDLFKKAAD